MHDANEPPTVTNTTIYVTETWRFKYYHYRALGTTISTVAYLEGLTRILLHVARNSYHYRMIRYKSTDCHKCVRLLWPFCRLGLASFVW